MYLPFFPPEKETWNYKSELKKLLTHSKWVEGNRVERGKGVRIPGEVFTHLEWIQIETKEPSCIQVRDITVQTRRVWGRMIWVTVVHVFWTNALNLKTKQWQISNSW